VLDLNIYLVIVAALAFGGICKGATGMGLPLIALPIMTLVISMPHAIVLMLFPVIATNIWQVVRFRGEMRDPRLAFLTPFVIAAAVGVGFGTWALTTLPARYLELVLGALLLGYFVLRMLRPSFAVSAPTARRVAVPVGVTAGVLQGATGISAPIGVTFIHAQRHGREAHLFAVSVMFLVLGVSHAAALGTAGIIQPRWIVESVIGIVPIIVAMPIGEWLSKKLSREAFDRMILIFLAGMGVKMLFGI
jgi:uncharacterized membrane protein YfcA